MIVVVDYGMGNSGSIVNMLTRIGVEGTLSADLDVIARAEKLILPGVGAFDAGMARLRELGIAPVLGDRVLRAGTPILGICLGLQLFAEGSDEGVSPGLGWIPGKCVRFSFGPEHAALRIPHMGWNTLEILRPARIFADLPPDPRFYFIHSYHLVCQDPAHVVARTEHGIAFTAAVASGSVYGTQFHPEKSLRWGMQVMRNFALHA
ncbi:MAG: imidazole glycerol phosphate synthase subunit HisH [Myxococcales bacterium]|nr:imidazole glycerol phosphate synthase subunit HisH [Myxococcales bacterium]